MSEQIVWEDLPRGHAGARGRPSMWPARLQPLMERPTEWARIATKPSPGSAAQLAASFRRGRTTTPPGRWEFASRTVENGDGLLYCVYARYIGPADGDGRTAGGGS